MITHDHKLIFIHIPKCAGRSISDAFNQRFDHFTARHYATEYPDCFHVYTKFTVVRNPYDRLVSLFHYIKEHRRHSTESIYCAPDFKTWLIRNMVAYNREARKDSPELERGTDGQVGSPFQFASQQSFLGTWEKQFLVFFFEDMNAVATFLEEKGNAKLGHLNSSKHTFWPAYYDLELCEICRYFTPIVTDCKAFNYKLL